MHVEKISKGYWEGYYMWFACFQARVKNLLRFRAWLTSCEKNFHLKAGTDRKEEPGSITWWERKQKKMIRMNIVISCCLRTFLRMIIETRAFHCLIVCVLQVFFLHSHCNVGSPDRLLLITCRNPLYDVMSLRLRTWTVWLMFLFLFRYIRPVAASNMNILFLIFIACSYRNAKVAPWIHLITVRHMRHGKPLQKRTQLVTDVDVMQCIMSSGHNWRTSHETGKTNWTQIWHMPKRGFFSTSKHMRLALL